MLKKFYKLCLVIFVLVSATFFINIDFINRFKLKHGKKILFYRQHVCDVFISKPQQKVVIDGKIYPKRTPLYQNNSINFQCLNQNREVGNKQILLWNTHYGPPLKNDLEELILNQNSSYVFDQLRCPVNNCELTVNRSRVNESALVLFHLRNIIDSWPTYRSSNQRWVHVIYESPVHCPQCDKYEGVFNLSASYKKDSDFLSLYYTASGINWTGQKKSEVNVFKTKNSTLFATALISNCNGRLDYIRELQNYITIDIYGNCGEQCPQLVDCRAYISSLYKFFFVFENSICEDYITEKFFDTLRHDIIPVVMGKLDYNFWIPPSGFINALDYQNAEDLAKYLINLSNDEEAYNKYFDWKRFLRFSERFPIQSYLCEMCIMLNLEETTGVVEKKMVKNMSSLYNFYENCWGFSHMNSGIIKGVNLDIKYDAGTIENTQIPRYR